MNINSDAIMSITEVNQNFSSAVRRVEKNGKVYIFKNNKPRFLLIDLEQEPEIEMTDEEKIEFIGRRILKDHKKAFEELAK
ncbi:MAG: type II toxin-antitoxin system Phd/YefM family antitoxin [Candidatus Ornithospirochaeta sp.]|nr:type II toxin-antitoxin system Phd/YefM family antitoxin [Spirochaetales bacterium]